MLLCPSCEIVVIDGGFIFQGKDLTSDFYKMPSDSTISRCSILDVPLSCTSYSDGTAVIVDWAKTNRSRAVCAANVHVVMEAQDQPDYLRVLQDMDMITPDGMPLVWVMRAKGITGQTRVYGPTLMLHVCEAAAAAGLPIGLYGGKPEVLSILEQKLTEMYPSLQVNYRLSPPFRDISDAEEEKIRQDIVDSGVRILFVGLGCPKQERWMARQKGKLPVVMLGVGAAFDFHAGLVRQAPAWIQRLGMEWFFRFCMEPRRLWKRYLKHNPRFVVRSLMEIVRTRQRKA